jgi:hypothetical protein
MSDAGAGSIAEAPPEIKQSNSSFACIRSIDVNTRLEALTPSSSGNGWLERNITIRLSVFSMLEFLGAIRIPETTPFPKMSNAVASIGALAFPTAITLILEGSVVRKSPI